MTVSEEGFKVGPEEDFVVAVVERAECKNGGEYGDGGTVYIRDKTNCKWQCRRGGKDGYQCRRVSEEKNVFMHDEESYADEA